LRECPDVLLALRLHPGGRWYEEIYNGPGRRVWDAADRDGRGTRCSISVVELARLAVEVAAADRIQLRE
jgi:hypothetical protein